jgi:hypothetical protein
MTNRRACCTLSGIAWHWISLSCFASFHTMWSHKWIPIFQRNILPPSARSRCLEWGCFPHAQHRNCSLKYWRKWRWFNSKDLTVSSSCYLKTWFTVHNRAFSCSSEWSNSMSPNHLQKGCFLQVCSIIHSCHLPFLNKVISSLFLYTLPVCSHGFTSYSPLTVLSDHIHQNPAYIT